MSKHKIVIIGAGFAGLYAAKEFANKNVDITIIDKRNFHLFQPLLYQVATGGLSPGDIASPIRAVFTKSKNIKVLCSELHDIDYKNKKVVASGHEIVFDSLIIATGVHHHYFGNEDWEKNAPGLKTVEDALNIRMRIMRAFEEAEFADKTGKRDEWLNFVIVGGGPTGVELAGALGELAHQTLANDFKNIDPRKAKIYLIEAGERILQSFPPSLSKKAQKFLEKLCVTVKTGTIVTNIDSNTVSLKTNNNIEKIQTRTILWAAGVRASHISLLIQKSFDANADNAGRIIVDEQCKIPGTEDVFIIGDLAHFKAANGIILPGVAQVAMQQGRFTARLILQKLNNKIEKKPFRYTDKGNMAVIGRKAAVAQIAKLHISGWPAWLIWIFIHIAYLIEYDNKLKVLLQWAWNFFTRKRGARLITQID